MPFPPLTRSFLLPSLRSYRLFRAHSHCSLTFFFLTQIPFQAFFQLTPFLLCLMFPTSSLHSASFPLPFLASCHHLSLLSISLCLLSSTSACILLPSIPPFTASLYLSFPYPHPAGRSAFLVTLTSLLTPVVSPLGEPSPVTLEARWSWAINRSFHAAPPYCLWLPTYPKSCCGHFLFEVHLGILCFEALFIFSRICDFM